MSDFLQMNLNRLSGIRDTAGRIAGERSGRRAERSRNIFDAFKTGAGVYTQGAAAKKLADAKAIEADKGRTAQNRAAARLADERGGVRDWERGEGFEQTKELEKLRADSRAALARLEASFRKDGDTGEFDIDEAFTRVMSYAVLGRPGEEWNQSWQPKQWTQEEKDRMLQKISQRISQYGEDGAAVQSMVNSYLAEFDHLFPEPAAEGAGGIPGWPFGGKTYNPDYPITGGYGPNTGAKPFPTGLLSPGESTTGGYYTAPSNGSAPPKPSLIEKLLNTLKSK